MGILRNVLLWGSENNWLRTRVPKFAFVKKAVKRFMPGENVEDAIIATKSFQGDGITTVLTYLGENISDLSEAVQVTKHYLEVLEKIDSQKLETEISLKLTQIGLDLSVDRTYENVKSIAAKALGFNNFLWIDMEGSSYTDVTIELYRRVRKEYSNVGICLQAYLYRTNEDMSQLLQISSAIRLVKGAYNEPRDIAFESKSKVDQNFMELAKQLVQASQKNGIRAAYATHDMKLIKEIENFAEGLNLSREILEFQMLYGIIPEEQRRLAKEGYKIRALISYGDAWFPWYMRRLAERPANVMFVLRKLFTR